MMNWARMCDGRLHTLSTEVRAGRSVICMTTLQRYRKLAPWQNTSLNPMVSPAAPVNLTSTEIYGQQPFSL